jgi:hypothetical protein
MAGEVKYRFDCTEVTVGCVGVHHEFSEYFLPAKCQLSKARLTLIDRPAITCHIILIRYRTLAK